MNQQQVYQQLRQVLGKHLNKANQWQIDNSTLAIFNYGTIGTRSLANAISICAFYPYGTSDVHKNAPLRKKFREGLEKKQAPSDFSFTSIRINRQIRVSDGTMFTYRTKKKVKLYNINLDFMHEMQDRFVLLDTRKNFRENAV